MLNDELKPSRARSHTLHNMSVPRAQFSIGYAEYSLRHVDYQSEKSYPVVFRAQFKLRVWLLSVKSGFRVSERLTSASVTSAVLRWPLSPHPINVSGKAGGDEGESFLPGRSLALQLYQVPTFQIFIRAWNQHFSDGLLMIGCLGIYLLYWSLMIFSCF